MVLVFLTQTLIAFFQRSEGWGFWDWVAASETAAWRLKWIAIPVVFAILWPGRKLYRSILFQPREFCGLKYARHGMLASSVVTLLIALLIGVTVPVRLEHRRLGKEAAMRAQGYAVERALTEYKIKYQTYPADVKDLLDRIPDPDGTLAAALLNVDSDAYRPVTAEVAEVATKKSRTFGGAAVRKASLSSPTDDTSSGGLSFISYVLRLPGEDKITGTDDDWIMRDGIIQKYSEIAKGGVGSSVSAGVLQP